MENKELAPIEQNQIAPREIGPAVWNMLSSIVEATASTKMEKAAIAKKILFAYESGMSLSIALNGGLYNVKNRIEVEGTIIRSKIDQLPNYHYKIERQDGEGAAVSLWRKAAHDWPFALYDGAAVEGDWINLGVTEFTIDDARQAGLLGKDNYQNYPADMFLGRATSRMYKRLIPWLFSSPVYVRGEIEGTDFSDAIEGEIVSNGGGVTFQELTALYTPAEIMEANDGRIPATPDEIAAVAAKLENGND